MNIRSRASDLTPASLARGSHTLAEGDSTSQSAERDDMGAHGPICGGVAPRTQDSSSVSLFALRRQVSAVRAVRAKERSHGSARGAPGNRRPYRNSRAPLLFVCGTAYAQTRRSIRLQAMWPMVM